MITHSKESVLRINLYDVSEEIEDRYFNYLVRWVPGMYLQGASQPILVEGQNYHYFNKEQQQAVDGVIIDSSVLVKIPLIDIYNLKDLDTVIYDENDEEILDTRLYKKVHCAFNKAPTMPFTGFNIVKDILESYVFSQVQYQAFPKIDVVDILEKYYEPLQVAGADSKTLKHFQNERRAGQEINAERISTLVQEYKNIIQEFMNRDYFHEYEVTVNKAFDFVLVKKQDFRIKEYYRLKAIVDRLNEPK